MNFPPRESLRFESLRWRRTLASAVVICLLLSLPTTAGVASRTGAAPPSRQTLQEAGGHEGEEGESAPLLVRRTGGLKKFGKGVLAFLSCPGPYKMKRQELLAYGPRFPDSYDPSDFSFEALINTRWPMAVEYELESQSTLTITIRVMNAQPFVKTLTGEGMGKPQFAHFVLPTYEGRGPHPALITFKATHDGTRGLSRAELLLSAVGAGDGAVTAAWKEPHGVEVAALGALPVGGTLPVTARRRGPSVNIYDVAFRPGRPGEYDFTFRVGDTFNRWAANINRTVRRRGRDRPKAERDDLIYNQTITPRRAVSGKWNGMGNDDRRKVPRDNYWVFVMVWYSAYDRGQWAAATRRSNQIPVN